MDRITLTINLTETPQVTGLELDQLAEYIKHRIEAIDEPLIISIDTKVELNVKLN